PSSAGSTIAAGTESPTNASHAIAGSTKKARSAGNGSQISTASPAATRFGGTSSTSRHAHRYAATNNGVASQYSPICTPIDLCTLSWSTIASGSPSGSTRQKSLP